ncbi:MAG: hypothetical protein ACM3ZO_08240, partial [Clostridia bacterium]
VASRAEAWVGTYGCRVKAGLKFPRSKILPSGSPEALTASSMAGFYDRQSSAAEPLASIPSAALSPSFY